MEIISIMEHVNNIGGTIAVVLVLCGFFIFRNHAERIKKLEQECTLLKGMLIQIQADVAFIRGKMEGIHDKGE